MKDLKVGIFILACLSIGLAHFLFEMRTFKEGITQTGFLVERLRSTHGLVVDGFSIAQAYFSNNEDDGKRWRIGKVTIFDSGNLQLSREVGEESWFEASFVSLQSANKKIVVLYSPTILLFYEICISMGSSFFVLCIFNFVLIEFRRMKEKVHLAKEKEQELKMLAHDMKGPVQVLEGLALSTSIGGVDKGIIRSVQKLKTMTQSVLDGKNSIVGLSLSLPVFLVRLREICDSMKVEYSRSFLIIDVVVDERLSKTMPRFYFSQFDIQKMLRIVENLIRNGIESQVESPQIKVNLEVTNKSLVMSICDNGPGIPNEVLASLSKGIGVTKKKEGHGLGLLDAIQTIKKLGHGFDISIAKNENRDGTCIQLTLPIFESAKIEKVVLVEDDELMIMLWKIKAREAGVQLIHFGHPQLLFEDKREWSGQAHFFMDGMFSGRDFLPEMVEFLVKKGLKNLYSISQLDRLNMPYSIRQMGKNEAMDFVFS